MAIGILALMPDKAIPRKSFGTDSSKMIVKLGTSFGEIPGQPLVPGAGVVARSFAEGKNYDCRFAANRRREFYRSSGECLT
jgi:uncharacterized membrane protein